MSGQTVQAWLVPLPAGALAEYYPNGSIIYRHPDWLGTSRLDSTPSRTVSGTVAYAPFGEQYDQSTGALLLFTGQGQDTATNLYDFPAREYNLLAGRWPSPDPGGLAAVEVTNPQTWNRYAYVRNSPLNLIDPSGLCDVFIGGITQSPDGTEGGSALAQYAQANQMQAAFPFSGGTAGQGISDVISQSSTASNVAQTAILAAARDPGPINVVTWSGGAQAFLNALEGLPSDIASRINNVTYLAPGTVSPLFVGTGSTEIIFGTGITNALVTTVSGVNDLAATNSSWIDCGHNLTCFLSNSSVQTYLSFRQGGACSNPSTTTRATGSGGSGDGGGGLGDPSTSPFGSIDQGGSPAPIWDSGYCISAGGVTWCVHGRWVK